MKDSGKNSSYNRGRRAFLRNTGCMLIGFNVLPATLFSERSTADSFHNPQKNSNPINSWIRLDTDGRVTVLTGKMELGQGIKTALMQIAAEELDVDLKRLNIVTADTGKTPDESYTAGSASIEGSGQAIRNAAAEARKQLLQIASGHLGVTPEKLTVRDGIVKAGERSVSYWQLLKGKQLQAEVTGKAPLKDPAEYKIVGTGAQRPDIIAMVTGMVFYIHDIRLPGMVHARVLRPPSYGAKLIALPLNEVKKIPGVLKVVKIGSFAGIMRTEEYAAIKALATLSDSAIWEKEPLMPAMNNLYADMVQQAGPAEVVEDDPAYKQKLGEASAIVEATYKRPYQMHGSIGPSCAIALWKDNKLQVWSHTQGVFPLRRTLADLLDIAEETINITGVPAAGCYGHNGADDVAAEAALLALQLPGKPVRLQWMREDEHRWEPYGPAMIMKIKAGLDEQGNVLTWHSTIWSDTHSTRPGGKAGHFISARYLEKSFPFSAGRFSGGSYRNALPLYTFAAKKVELHDYNGPLRTSALRSLGAYANIFALESFVDELALKAGVDQADFRLKHLNDDRAKTVINLLMEKTNWKHRSGKPGYGRGLAFAKYKNQAAYCAVLAEVSADKKAKTFSVTKLTAVIDAGQIINLDGIKNQTSGGMIQSASWSLLEEVTYDSEGIKSNTWQTYPILRFADVPDTEVFVINRPTEEPLGGGEAAQGPTAAAIANAIVNATGTRLRQLPFKAGDIKWQDAGKV